MIPTFKCEVKIMIKKEVLDYVVKETNALINAGSCCKEAKEAAEKWLKAIGTPDEAAETERYIKELEEDIEGIDDLVAFASSPLATQIFGEEKAKAFLAHAEELKKSGAKYCDCPACTACANILSKKTELLG